MPDDAADVIQGEIGQACVAVTGKEVFAVFPDGLVNVHAGTVISHDRLRHKRCGLAVSMGDIPDDVFHVLCPVGTFDQCRETCTDFILAGTGHFVVMDFDRNAHAFHQGTHFRTHVLKTVDWRNREITSLDCRTMTCIAAFDLETGRP